MESDKDKEPPIPIRIECKRSLANGGEPAKGSLERHDARCDRGGQRLRLTFSSKVNPARLPLNPSSPREAQSSL
jgi:hypothetical protein